MIIDEYKYVKNIIDSKEKPKEVSIKKLISYIAKFYYEDHKDDSTSKYKDFIFCELENFKLDSSYYRKSLYDKFVGLICKKILKGEINRELSNPVEIKLTKKELEIIQSVPSEKYQKLLFTMYVLAKTRRNSQGWVNYSLKEIFQCANINIKRDEKILMINDLKSLEVITTSMSYKRVGFKVNYEEVNEDNPYVFTISDFNNIGNQYIASIRVGWKMCECCGRLVKMKGPATKYCNKCAYKIKLEQNNEYYHNKEKINEN